MATETRCHFSSEAQEENQTLEPLTFDILHSTGAGADCSKMAAGGGNKQQYVYDGKGKEVYGK